MYLIASKIITFAKFQDKLHGKSGFGLLEFHLHRQKKNSLFMQVIN